MKFQFISGRPGRHPCSASVSPPPLSGEVSAGAALLAFGNLNSVADVSDGHPDVA